MRHIVPLTALTIVAAILGTTAWLMQALVEAAPRGWRQEVIRLSPAPSGPSVLNWHDLGQPQAVEGTNPSRLLATVGDGGWWLANGGRGRVTLRTGSGLSRDLAALPLADGDRIDLDRVSLSVEITHGQLRLRDAHGKVAQWDVSGGVLTLPEGRRLEHCMINSWDGWRVWGRQFLRRILGEIGQHSGSARTVLSIGGAVQCGNRWPVETLPPESLLIQEQAGRHFLIARREDVAIRLHRADGRVVDVQQPWMAIDDGIDPVKWLSIGPVRYQVETENGDLVLRPSRGRGLFPHPIDNRPGLSFDWESSENGTWLGGGDDWPQVLRHSPWLPWVAAGGVIAVIAAELLRSLTLPPGIGRRWWHGLAGRTLMAASSAVLGIAWLVAITQPGIDLRVAISIAAGTWMLTTIQLFRRSALIGLRATAWVLTTIIVSGGLLTQLQIAALMPGESYIDIPRKTALALGLLAATVTVATCVPGPTLIRLVARLLGLPDESRQHQPRLATLVRWAVPTLVLVLLLIQSARGTEAGLGLMQPSQFATTTFILCLGWIGSWFLYHSRLNLAQTPWPRVFTRLLFGAMVIGLAIPVMLLMVDDNSPILIMSAIVGVWLLSLSYAVRNGLRGCSAVSAWVRLPTFLAVLLGLTVIGVCTIMSTAPETIVSHLPSQVRERLALVGAPLDHPAAYQVIRSFSVVSKAPVVADPSHSFAVNDRTVRLLPEVESDMVVAFMLFKHGLAPVATLAVLQVMFTSLTVLLAWRSITADGSTEMRLSSSFIGLSLLGFITAIFSHWMIGYSNALSGLIMGVPFTFYSAGSSHLIAVALPAITLTQAIPQKL